MRDWADLEECTCTCRCNAVFRSKHQIDYKRKVGITEKPCPNCGGTETVWSASYDPEEWSISSKDIGKAL